jgi:hypothetical protein
VGRQWDPCALGDRQERAISREGGAATLAQLREFYAVQQAHPGLTGTALAEQLEAIARRHPLPEGDDG